MSELESLFSTAAPNSELGSTGGKLKGRASGPKTEKVQLVIKIANPSFKNCL